MDFIVRDMKSERESEKERTFKCTSLTEHSCVIH